MKNLSLVLKLSFQNLFSRKKFYAFLFLNIFVGLFGFFVVQIFQSSLQSELKSKALSTTGGDFSIVASQKFTDQQIIEFEKNLFYEKKTALLEFFAMIQVGDRNRLVSIKAFDDKYPLYGEIGSDIKKISIDDSNIWLDPELIDFLKINKSQTSEINIKIGELKFNKFEVITKDSTRFLKGTGFAPSVYISRRLIENSDLIKEGSTLRNYLIYSVANKDSIVESENKFYSQIKDPTIRFENAEKKSENNNTAFKYFSDYLGLVSIISMALCFLATRYLLNWIFNQEKVNFGIYKALGLSHKKSQLISFLPILIISVFSYIFSVLIIFVSSPLLNQILLKLKIPLVLQLNFSTLVFVFLISIFSPLVMFIPTAMAIKQLSPKFLLHNFYQNIQHKKIALWFLLIMTLFWLLSFYQSKSYKIASVFSFGMLAIILSIYLLVLTLTYVLKKQTLKRSLNLNWTWLYAYRSLLQKSSVYMTVIITFTLSTVILTLLPHLKESIQNEIRPQSSSKLPKLFLFDIQKDQINEINRIANVNNIIDLNFIPLVRSRILKLNDQDFSRIENDSNLTTREQEEEMRSRNRGVNLTYASELKESESIVEGQWNGLQFKNEGLPQISLEQRYAERIKAKLGDQMTFDVQGLEIKGLITSIRSVRWTSFNPNFFILFQPGILEEAPQNFLTSVNSETDLKKFQSEIVSTFSNVSIIDVRTTAQEVLVFVSQMSVALQIMAFISMLLGLIVLMVITMTQINEQLNEFNLLKVMGSQVHSIVKTIQIQFMIITVFSLFFGSFIGIGLAYLLTQVIFNISFSPDLTSIFILFFGVSISVFILIYILTRPLMRLTPMQLMRS